MLTGRTPFRGTPAELIFQHQHGVLPLKQLKSVPQRVKLLLKKLLDKDPKRRFQTPVELLKTIAMVASQLEKPANETGELRTPPVRRGSSRRTELSPARAHELSIAVLPFESLSANKADTYFADGVQDEILSNLAKLSQLKVISRTSVMTYRPRTNRDLRSIARILGVTEVAQMVERNWQQATELIERMKSGEALNFSYIVGPVSPDCYFILLARFQGQQPSKNTGFAAIREQLSQKVQASPESAGLLSNLAVLDALLDEKHKAITEAKRTVEMLPTSQDAVGGPAVLKNLAVVYTWTEEPDLAFETLHSLTKVPSGIYYGDLKLDPYWDPLRKDPRFEKLLVELVEPGG